MNTKKLMVAMRPNSAVIKAAVTIMIALTVGLACTSTTAYAKKKKVKYGTIEITTNPGGFPLRIDGQPQGDTSTTPRVIELEPGHHNLEIMLPNGGRWVRDFDVERARKLCLNLSAPQLRVDGVTIGSQNCQRRRHAYDHGGFHRARQPACHCNAVG